MQIIHSDEELKQAAGVFARAFVDYPLYTYLFPDQKQREKLLPILFEISARYIAQYVYCIKNDGKVQAVLLIDAPGHKGPSIRDLLSLLVNFARKLPFRKSIKMLSVFRSIEKMKPQKAFYYIQTIAVDPNIQGKGLGQQVVNFAKSLAGSNTIYLETNSGQNVAYYEKLDFVQYATFKCDNGKGPSTYSFTWSINNETL
ncbi:MAG: GNAT family N-acetyltransferase [Chitinophagales bacterium]